MSANAFVGMPGAARRRLPDRHRRWFPSPYRPIPISRSDWSMCLCAKVDEDVGPFGEGRHQMQGLAAGLSVVAATW